MTAPKKPSSFLARVMMMEEAIASCVLEGIRTDRSAIEMVLIEDGVSPEDAAKVMETIRESQKEET